MARTLSSSQGTQQPREPRKAIAPPKKKTPKLDRMTIEYRHREDGVTAKIDGDPGMNMDMGEINMDVFSKSAISGYPKIFGTITVNTFMGSVRLEMKNMDKATDMLIDFKKEYDEVTKRFSIYIKTNLIEMELNGTYNESTETIKFVNMTNFLRFRRRKEVNIGIKMIRFISFVCDPEDLAESDDASESIEEID